jgi:UDP-N-acetylmuramate dehydrogenase
MENYIEKIDFKRYSSIKIGPIVDVLVINKIDDYRDYQIIGQGNNIVVSKHPPKFA